MMKSVGRRVDVILDASAAPYPPSPAALPHFQRAWDKLSPHMGLVVVVGAGGFFQQVGALFARLFIENKDRTLRFVRTMDEAQQAIAEREDLPQR
jgi:hypothetical protein